MAGLENLFAAEPQLPNTYKTKMPDAPEKWAETITTMAREQFPDIAKLPLTVNFRKRDDQSGYAVGAIHVVSVEAGKSVYIPFVVEKNHMHPLDVWMEKQTQAVHPITPDTFKEVFFVRNISEGLDARPTDSTGNYFNDPSMWNQTYPPLQGRYSYASAGYQILDEISDSLSKLDLEAFRTELKSEPMLLQKFERNGNGEIIQKLAAKSPPVNTRNYREAAANLIPTAAVSIKKKGLDSYSVLTIADGYFNLASSCDMSQDDAKKFLANINGVPQDVLNEVDQSGEKLLITSPVMDGVWLYDAQEKGAVSADEFSCYTLKNKNGILINAVVIPKVLNYEGKAVTGKIALSNTHSCMQNSIAGIQNKDSACMTAVLKPHPVCVGQMGTFVYVGTNGKAVATVPVTIKAIENGDMLHVVDMNGKQMRIRRGWEKKFVKVEEAGKDLRAVEKGTKETEVSLEAHGFVEVKPGHFVIPMAMMWIPMSPMTEVISSSKEWTEKTAAAKMEINPIEMRYTGIVYEFKGGDLPKIACDETQADLLLANLGLSLEKIAKAKKKAKHAGKCSIHGAKKLKDKKEAEDRAEEAYEKVASACKNLKRSLVKCAAEIDNKATVDTVLAIGFINPENLAKFISYVPVLEKAADYLAEITLASRLGLKQVNEAATTGAMSKIIEVVDGLKKVRSSTKKITAKVG